MRDESASRIASIYHTNAVVEAFGEGGTGALGLWSVSTICEGSSSIRLSCLSKNAKYLEYMHLRIAKQL